MTLSEKALVALFLALTGLLVGAYFGYDYASSKADAKYESHLAADRKAEENAQRTARMHEYELALAANAAAESYEKGKKDAENESQKTVDDLLDGSLRLQNRWAGCEADRMSEAATTAGKLNAATRDRAESASRIIAAAAACDAKDRAWQQWAAATTSILTKASAPK